MSVLSTQQAPGDVVAVNSTALLNSTSPTSLQSIASNVRVPSPDLEYKDAPVSELWDLAYEKLRKEDKALIAKYEERLQENLPAALRLAPGSKVSKREWVDGILKYKMEEVCKKAWKFKFRGSEVEAKEVGQPILKVIKVVNDSITTAVVPSPYASIAWTGVSAMILLLLNPMDQAASLAKGLEYIASLIVQSRIREDLYHRSCIKERDGDRPLLEMYSTYKSVLGDLYQEILRYQITCYCYYSQSKAHRLASDLIKQHNWNELAQKIYPKEEKMASVLSEFKHDKQYEEECNAAEKRHQEMIDDLTAIGADISDLRNMVEAASAQQDYRQFLHWLCDIDPSEMYNAACNKHEDGTSEWLIKDNEDFEMWMKSPRSLLWLHGKAGAGKSILSSSVIKHLKEYHKNNPLVVVAYFYFSFSDIKKQETDGMLASLIKQICSRRPDISKPIERLGEYKNKGERPATSVLEETLIMTMCGFSTVYIVIDALDECPELSGQRKQLMRSLGRILNATADNYHVFCTSRREADIDAELSHYLFPPKRISLDLSSYRRKIEHDMSLYIDKTLAGVDYKSWPESIKAEVKRELIDKSDGMFQYIRCQFEALQRIRSPSKIHDALKDLPKGLDETYGRMLENVHQDYQTQVINSLKWLAFSVEPLQVGQLAEIFIIQPKDSVVIDNERQLFNARDVLGFFPGLVTVEGTNNPKFSDAYSQKEGEDISKEEKKIVRLAHFSIKEYLVSGRAHQVFSFSETDAHLFIASSCLVYHIYISDISYMVKDSSYELKRYAALNWAVHLEMVPRLSWPDEVLEKIKYGLAARSETLLNMILAFRENYEEMASLLMRPNCFFARRGFSRLTLTLLSSKFYETRYFIQEDLYGPLYEAVSKGNKELAILLLNHGANANAISMNREWMVSDDFPTDALQAAIYRKDSEMVSLLIDRGANVNVQRGRWGSALQVAAKRGHLDILKLLVQYGAVINNPSNEAGCVLSSAVTHLKCLLFLLDSRADINMCGTGIEERTALCRAAAENRWDAFDLLLEKGAEINRGGKGGYPLHVLAKRANVSRLKRLLELGADPNIRDENGCSALYVACADRSMQIVQLLIDSGADVNMVGEKYGGALQVCAKNGNMAMAELLLKNGADVRIQGGEFGDALQAACCGNKDNLAMVQLLLDHGAGVNIQGGYYGTALQAACCKYHNMAKVVPLLLEQGAEVNIQGGFYGTALQAACCDEHNTAKVVPLLLEQGAEVNIQSGCYGTALQEACFRRFVAHSGDAANWIKMVRLLLDHVADINAVGSRYGTALQAVCYAAKFSGRDHSCAHARTVNQIVRLLLERGADVNAQGGRFGTALQALCQSSRVDIMRLLLDHGADVNILSDTYGTALQVACSAFPAPDIEMVRLLLENGANVLEPGGEYGSAWHAAIKYCGELDITLIQLLLKHGAYVNYTVGEFGSALHYVLSPRAFQLSYRYYQAPMEDKYGFEKQWISAIDFLLDHGADINLEGGKYGFPLQAVCALEHAMFANLDEKACHHYTHTVPKIVKMLLLHNNSSVNINACGGLLGTALQAAAYSGQTKSVQMLLERGAYATCNHRCGKYRSALNAAVIRGHWDIVDNLLKAGAKPDCHLRLEIDEEWLAQVREEQTQGGYYRTEGDRKEEGRRAEARYRKFWGVESKLYWQALLARGRHVAYYHLITAWWLFRFQLFIRFMTLYIGEIGLIKGKAKK